MPHAHVNGVKLEYEVTGGGEPVLLISPVLADGFLPLLSEPSLAHGYQLITYRERGWMGSTHTLRPVSVADHAADAAALLAHLGVDARIFRALERRRRRRAARRPAASNRSYAGVTGTVPSLGARRRRVPARRPVQLLRPTPPATMKQPLAVFMAR